MQANLLHQHPFIFWAVVFLILCAFARLLWWVTSIRVVQAILITLFLSPLLAVYAALLGFRSWRNAINWTYAEYLRKLNAKDHTDPGL